MIAGHDLVADVLTKPIQSKIHCRGLTKCPSASLTKISSLGLAAGSQREPRSSAINLALVRTEILAEGRKNGWRA